MKNIHKVAIITIFIYFILITLFIARGTRDYQLEIGRLVLPIQDSTANQTLVVVGREGDITAGSTIIVGFDVPGAGIEYIYENVIVSVDDDSAIHRVRIYRESDGVIITSAYFINSVQIPLGGIIINEGDNLVIDILNNGDSTIHGRIGAIRINRKVRT